MRLKERKTGPTDPNYLAYRYLWRNLEAAVGKARLSLPSNAGIVLDLGCGNKPYADLFLDMTHIGLNNTCEDATPDIVGDATNLPIASRAVDLVFCTQVLEHVRDPWSLARECFRVLKPGGWLILSAPFYWPLHEEPHDYYRFTRYGLEVMMKEAGFTQCHLQADGGDYARLCLSLIQSLPRWMSAPLRIPLNIIGAALDGAFGGTTLPANYTVLARA